MAIGDGTNYSTTTQMGLRTPTPGVCGGLGVEPPGLSWMEIQNAAFGIVDQHNHTPGLGSQIPTAGLNINADLTFNNYNLIALRSTRFGAISLGSLAATDVGCLIVSGVDLYYVDINGNQVRITSGGSVAGSPGSITGLSSPAAATYTAASKLFAFTSASGFAAGLSCGPLVLTDSQTLNGKSVTIQSPSGLASSYTVTMPTALPGSNALLSMSTAGALSAFGTVSGNNLTLAGSLTTGGAITVAGNINGVTDPTTAQQAATKNYVDSYNLANLYAIYNVFSGTFSSSGSVINFDSMEADPSSLVTTGAAWKFTVPAGKGGIYQVNAYVAISASSFTGSDLELSLYKNGSSVHQISKTSASPGTPAATAGSTLVSLAAGDYIDLRAFTGGSSPSMNAGRVSIIRVQ